MNDFCSRPKRARPDTVLIRSSVDPRSPQVASAGINIDESQDAGTATREGAMALVRPPSLNFLSSSSLLSLQVLEGP